MLKKLMLKLGYVPIKTLRPDPVFSQMRYQQELFSSAMSIAELDRDYYAKLAMTGRRNKRFEKLVATRREKSRQDMMRLNSEAREKHLK